MVPGRTMGMGLITSLVFLTSACSSFTLGEPDEASAPTREPGIESKMETWAIENIPSTWGSPATEYSYNPSTSAEGQKRKLEVTSLTLTYGSVTKNEFGTIEKLAPNSSVECNIPQVNDTAGPPVAADQTVVETCGATALEGASGVSMAFGMDATWNGYEDGSTRVDITLSNE